MKSEHVIVAIAAAMLLVLVFRVSYTVGKWEGQDNPRPERVTIISELPSPDPCDCEWKDAQRRVDLAVSSFNRDMREQGRPYRLMLAKVEE